MLRLHHCLLPFKKIIQIYFVIFYKTIIIILYTSTFGTQLKSLECVRNVQGFVKKLEHFQAGVEIKEI